LCAIDKRSTHARKNLFIRIILLLSFVCKPRKVFIDFDAYI